MNQQPDSQPQIAPTEATQPGAANESVENLLPAANELEQSSLHPLDDSLEAGPALGQEPPLAEEHDVLHPVQDHTSPAVLAEPHITQAPELPADSQVDAMSSSEPLATAAPIVSPDDGGEAPALRLEQTEENSGDEQAEPLPTDELDALEAPQAPVIESMEPDEISGEPFDSDPAQGPPPSLPQEEEEEPPECLPNTTYNPEKSIPNGTSGADEDAQIPPEALEVPAVESEPTADAWPAESPIESAAEPVVFPDREQAEAAPRIPEMPATHEEPCHGAQEEPAATMQEEQEATMHVRLERPRTTDEERITIGFVEDAPQNGDHVHLQERQKRLDQDQDERKSKEKEEADARELLQELEQERDAAQAQEDEAAQVAAQEQKAGEADRQEQKDPAKLRRERSIRERAERETLEQVYEAKRLLALMEQEIRATEAQDEIEKAALAERAKRENEQLEYKQMQRERLEQHRRNTEARLAANGTTSAQKETEQVEAARRAIEEASRDRVPNDAGPPPMPPTGSQERRAAAEPARAQTPPSGGYRAQAQDHSPGQSDRPFRSYRSFAPHARKLRTQGAGPNYPPKPYAVSRFMDDDIPPAPSPPMSRVRPM